MDTSGKPETSGFQLKSWTRPLLLTIAPLVIVVGIIMALISGGSTSHATVRLSAATSTQVQQAIDYATSYVGKDHDDGWCLQFMKEAWGAVGVTINPSDTALSYWNSNPNGWVKHPSQGAYNNPPAGALVFWGPNQYSSLSNDGHVGLSLGNNQVVSTAASPYANGDPNNPDVLKFNLSERPASNYNYLGYIMPLETASSSQTDSSKQQKATPTKPSQPAATAGSATSSGAPAFSAIRKWTWTSSNSDGYQFGHVLEAGDPVHVADAPAMPGLSSEQLQSLCANIDPTIDAVVPIRITLTNNTPNYGTLVQSSFALPATTGTSSVPTSAQVLSNYGQQARCVTFGQLTASNDQSNWTVDCTLVPTTSCVNNAYLVLPDYYTPAAPNGNSSLFDGAQLFILGWDAIGHVDELSGPGVSWDRNRAANGQIYDYGTVIPLSGNAIPANGE